MVSNLKRGDPGPVVQETLRGGQVMFELVNTQSPGAVIKVIGVGGGGSNAVQHMLNASIEGVEFICANTDAQALNGISARTLIQLGSNVTRGLGAGADPEKGRQAALEDRDRLMDVLEGADMVFITVGMGGGTGTGAAPVVAQVAKEMGILTVAVVTRPFSFEGRKRAEIAGEGIRQISQYVDSLITIPNDKLLSVLGRDISLLNAFKAANDVLLGAVQGIAELITSPGLINVDFADVRTVMAEMGMAMMGSGLGKGQNRARIAAEAAVASPLLEDVNLAGARGMLVNITASMDITLGEFEEVGNTVKGLVSDGATVVIGTSVDQQLSDEVRVTVVATGIGGSVELLKEEAVTPLRARSLGEVDYKALDRPTVIRNKAKSALPIEKNMPDYLDIPAFLRRQAD